MGNEAPGLPGALAQGSVTGLTLRDYLAAAAVSGFVAREARGTQSSADYERQVAEAAYGVADAMLEARK